MKGHAMETSTKTTTGVQELIEKIRDQGVQSAQEESAQLLQAAKKQAAEILAKAKADADAEQAKARAEIESFRKASMDALQLAVRDTVLELKSRVVARFEEFVKRLVVSATHDKELVRDIVLVLSGHAADEFIKDKTAQVRISQSLLDGEPAFKEEGKQAILGLSSDMLREGLELASDDEVEGGVRVQLINDKLEIDLSDRAVSRLIAQRMIPRFKAILEGAE
jgi:V/A-type H+/Na+-transporting ATPase subunit E